MSKSKIDFSAKLRNGRLAANMTQIDVSKAIGRPQQTIGSWETGKAQPDANTIGELLLLYGIDANDFFDFDPDAPSIEEAELLKRYRALDPHGKEMVDVVLDKEHARVEQEAKQREEAARAVKMKAVMANAQAPASKRPTINMTVYDDPAAAGSPNPAESTYEVLTLNAEDVPDAAEFGIRIAGDSMEQAVPNGCIAWVESKNELFNNQIGIFGLEEGFVCKRAKIDAQGKITALESDNPQYADIDGEALWGMRIIGEVIGTYCED